MNDFQFLVLALITNAFSHGLDKPGPHKGYVRMPGAFHTEVVPLNENQWKVFLLDSDLKKPQVTESSVAGFVEMGKEKISLVCAPQDDHFLCSLPPTAPRGTRLKLRLDVKRSSASGIAVYSLPLSFQKF